MKLRLLVLKQCNRNCPLCSNKNFDLDELPTCEDYSEFDEIILTGGEPMLVPELVKRIILEIKGQSSAKVFLYTAMPEGIDKEIIDLIDGVTLTLHEANDYDHFIKWHGQFLPYLWNKSLRLKVFKEVGREIVMSNWQVQNNLEWIVDCPLPIGEIFMKYGG